MAETAEQVRPAPVLRPYALAGLILLGAWALVATQLRDAGYEAQAVVQVRVGDDILALIEAHLMARDALAATAKRHWVQSTGADATVTLRQSVALHELTSAAGSTLGLAPQVAGVVISVRLPQAAQAVQVANDLALQVMDLGQSGELDADHGLLVFYRGEEDRLWQEVAALKAELSTAARTKLDAPLGGARKLTLLQDQYELVSRHLAEAEVNARWDVQRRSAQFALLQRATEGQAVRSDRIWLLLASLATATLFALVVASTVERRPLAAAKARVIAKLAEIYRMIDDPARPLFGMPRFVVISGGLVAMLVTASVLLH